MLHRLSARDSYVALNCTAIPAALLESELFGFERGAFTNANQRRIGKIEEASGGTLVLDEIGDMPLETQAKLLRVIQENAITRLGSNERIDVDLRIMALTNQDLQELVRTGKFREDLFYRLRVHQLTMPPLRQRPEDIPHLVRHFALIYAHRNRVAPAGFSEAAEEALARYPWPGNVRELENEILRIMEMLEDGELINVHHLLPEIACPPAAEADPDPRRQPALIKDRVHETEKREIEALLQVNRGNKTRTAKDMGLSYRGFLKKVKRLGIS